MSKKLIIFSVGVLILGVFIFLVSYFLNFKYLFAGINRCCGNGRLDWGEECDKTVSETDYLNSPYAKDLDGDTDVDSVDYNIMKNTCNDECSFGCPPSDPHFADINKGCYQPEGSSDPCQKGVWACDYHTGKIKCLDVYSTKITGYEGYYIGQEIYDYCCGDYDPTTSPIPSASLLASVKKIAPPGGGHKCDEVCRENGGICIGIGKYATMTCEITTCHNTSGSACPGGQCRSWGKKGTCSDVFTGSVSCPDGSQPPESCANIIFVGGSNCYCYIPPSPTP